MSRVRFVVYGKCQPAGSKRAFVHPKTGRAIVTDANAKSKPWQQEVAGAAHEAMDGRPPFTGPVELWVIFSLARPKGHYGSGRNAGTVKDSAPMFPTGRPDCTKLLRGLEDALTGIVWLDDAQVVLQKVSKVYGLPQGCVVEAYEFESATAGAFAGEGREVPRMTKETSHA